MSTESCVHQFDFTDRNRTQIKCRECGAKELLPPSKRDMILAGVVRAGMWVGPALQISGAALLDAPPANTEPTPANPALASVGPPLTRGGEPAVQDTRGPQASAVIAYDCFDGQRVELTVKLFQQMLCPQATEMQARYALSWCSHNRIDPFSNEAYFAVMEGKLVIQVSKDAWFKRVENNPRFVSHDGGIIVETALKTIKESILGGMDDYLIAPALKEKLLAEFLEGKESDPKGVSPRLVVKKRGIFLAAGEHLLGGWAEVRVNDRPHPYRFEIDKDGWQTTMGSEKENVFWRRKGPFMAWKSALKNCCRLAFPDLSGLMSQREAPEDFDPAEAADYELAQRAPLQRKLFAVGREVPPPVGPLDYPALHRLAVENFDGRGISELAVHELTVLVETVERAAKGDAETLRAMQEDLSHGRTESPDAETIGRDADGNLQPVS